MEENRQTRDECFRVLRPDEVDNLAEFGLVAKNKDEKGASVAEHIRNGSTPGYKSQYISLTASLDCACKFAGMFQEIARVSLPHKLLSDSKRVIDFSNSTNRNQELPPDGLIFAKRSEEILVLSKIEHECVRRLVRTFTVLETSTCAQVLFDSLRGGKSEVVGGPNDGLLRLVGTNSKPLIAKRPKPNIRNDELCSWEEMRVQTVQEYVCFQIYKICGIHVPDCDFLEVNVQWKEEPSGNQRANVKCTVLLLENFKLLDDSSTKEERDSLKERVTGSREFANGFIVDCFVGNWQVLDVKLKNVDKDGFRANLSRVAGFQTSEDKSKGYNVLPFGKEVLEIDELRKQAPFSLLSNADIGKQIEMLLSHTAKFEPLLARLSPNVRKVFEQRLEFLRSWLNWTQIAPKGMLLPFGRDGHVTFCSKEDQAKLFVFGGNSNEGAVNDLLCFDLNKSEWRRVAGNGAFSPRFSCSAACVGNYAFIIGGTDMKSLFGNVAVFNTTSEEWETDWKQVGWPETGLCRHACAVVHNQIFLFGGETKEKNAKSSKLKRVGRFFVGRVTKKLVYWEEIHDMSGPAPVHRHAMCANKDSVFLLGGLSNDHSHAFSKLHIFDISTKKWKVEWTDGASVIGDKIRAGHSLFLWDNELVVFGGGALSKRRGGEAQQEAFGPNVVSTLSCKMFALNLENFSWRELTDKLAGSSPCAMSGQSCSLLKSPKRVIIFGGRCDNDEFSSNIFSLRMGPSEEVRLGRIREKLEEVKKEVKELRNATDLNVLLERIQGMERDLSAISKKHTADEN